MSEKIGLTLTRLFARVLWGLGNRESASIYIGCPIDPASLPLDLAGTIRLGRGIAATN